MPSEQWLAEVLARPGYRVVGEQARAVPQDETRVQEFSTTILRPDHLPRLLLHDEKPPYKSKTEARYADLLNWRMACGEVKRWIYEPFSLRLGHGCHYRPDFLLEYVEPMPLQLVEVKGSWIRDRAMDKVRAAATRFSMFTFVLARWDKQRWTHTRIAAHG